MPDFDARELFKPTEGVRPTSQRFYVGAGSVTNIRIHNLPEDACICVDGVHDVCGSAPLRWPLIGCDGDQLCVCGPQCAYVGTFDEPGVYELTTDGDLGEAEILATEYKRGNSHE